MSSLTSKMNYFSTYMFPVLVRMVFLICFVVMVRDWIYHWGLYEKFLANPQAALGPLRRAAGVSVASIQGAFWVYLGMELVSMVWLWFPAKKGWALWQLFWLLALVMFSSDFLYLQLEEHYRCCDEALQNIVSEYWMYGAEFCWIWCALLLTYVKSPRRAYYVGGFVLVTLLRAAFYHWL